MAITEKWEGRVTSESMDGANMKRVFQMTFTEYDATFDIYVGDLLGNSDLDSDFSQSTINLRVVRVEQHAIDNTNTRIEVFYSTQNSPNIQAIADAANSWTETFDISSVDEAVDSYTDQGSGSVLDWAADWAANKPAGASDTEPQLIISNGRLEFRLTTYSSTLYLQRIMYRLNKINGVNFLKNYFSFSPQSDIDTDITLDDDLQWLFASCPITRHGKNVFRYDFTFRYSGPFEYGWNNVYGLEVVRYDKLDPDTGLLFDFMSLFVGMDSNIDTDISVRTGR